VAGKFNTDTSESIVNHAQTEDDMAQYRSPHQFFFMKTELCNWNCYKLCN